MTIDIRQVPWRRFHARTLLLILLVSSIYSMCWAESTAGYLGVVVARQQVELTSPADTSVLSVFVHPGDKVAAGDELMQLDSRRVSQSLLEAEAALTTAHAEVRAAEEALGLAKSKLERRRKAPQAISVEEMESAEHEVGLAKAQLDAAHARVTQAQARVAQLRVRLESMTVTAPINATVSERRVDPGSDVAQGELLLRLISADDLFIRFAVPPTDSAELKPGKMVHVRIESNKKDIEGQITHIAPGLDGPSQMIFVEAALDDPTENVRPGLTVRVKMNEDLRKSGNAQVSHR